MECSQRIDAKLSQIYVTYCLTTLRQVCSHELALRPHNMLGCFCASWAGVISPVQAQLALGAQGLPVLCTIVKEEREDTDMLRAALECLSIAIGNPTQHSENTGKVLQRDTSC